MWIQAEMLIIILFCPVLNVEESEASISLEIEQRSWHRGIGNVNFAVELDFVVIDEVSVSSRNITPASSAVMHYFRVQDFFRV